MLAPSNPIRFAELVAHNPLSVAEQDFVACMAEGEECKIGDKCPTEARDGTNGEKPNIIRADLIRFFAWGGDESHPIRGNLISLSGAVVSGRLNLSLADSPRGLFLAKCHLTDLFVASYSRLRFLDLNGSRLARGLMGNATRVDSDVFMSDGFESEIAVNLSGARIGGGVFCDGGTFKGSKGCAINATYSTVGGNFVMRDGFCAKGKVDLTGVNIGGDMSCDGGYFQNTNKSALVVEGGRVKGSVFMRTGFCADGAVRFLDANIGGEFACNGGRFNNKAGYAINADGIKVGGFCSMDQGFSAEGGVRLLSATIDGGICCDGGIFNNKDGYALIAEKAEVDGYFFMRADEKRRFCANGIVHLVTANITGDLDCSGGMFMNAGGNALVADGIKIGGNLRMDLRDRDKRFRADGNVRLVAAEIGVSWGCHGGIFNGDIVAESAKIGNSLFWQNVHGKGECNLSFAAADVFDYNEKSLRGFEFILDEFSYKRFAMRKSVESRLNWLESRPDGKDFSPQPFEQTAKVLFAMGHRGDAREVLFAMEKHRTEKEDAKFSGWRKHWRRLWRGAWEKATGYNHLVRNMLATSAGIVFVSALFFGVMDYGGYVVPHQPVVLANADYQDIAHRKKAHVKNCLAARQARPRPTDAVECLFPNYPRFNPLSFSVDIFVPLFSLRQEGYWYPQADANVNFAIRWLLLGWYWAVVIAGWVLTSIFALTITGIWQRQQAGG